jgi:xylose isomerase
MSESAYDPTPQDRFSFGLWTVGNPGRDPFGSEVRPRLSPVHIVKKLAECGAYGVNLHDDDLVPPRASARERDAIVAEFRRALRDHGLCVPMATTNLFSHTAIGRMREALDFLCGYVESQGYDLVFALEAKPNEPRGDIYLPTTGHMLHFISTLKNHARVGVNPEVAHENMAGLSFVHAVAQAMEADKLFHIDLNAQKIGRFDQDLRFGSEDLKQAFLLVRLLEGTLGGRRYSGPLHFDSHAYRSEDEAGVWDFARGSMRTYKILNRKAQAFDADPEVRGLIRERRDAELDPLLSGACTPARIAALKALKLDPEKIAEAGLAYEKLDQLMMEHLMGVRG